MRKLIFISVVLGFFSCTEKESDIDDAMDPDTLRIETIITDTIIIDSGMITPDISSGFFGYVIEWKGDFMPNTENPGTIDSVENELYIYKALPIDSVMHARTDDYLFWNIDSIGQNPIAIIHPNERGFYQISLDTGTYSGLVKIDDPFLYTGNIGRILSEMQLSNEGLIQINHSISYEADH